MTALATLADIKAIALTDTFIQGLAEDNATVVFCLNVVDSYVKQDLFGDLTQIAQTYAAAHLISMANQPTGGRGPVSSESIGGISRSYTLPWLNQKTNWGGTQYGLFFLQLRDSVIVPFDVAVGPLVEDADA